MAINVTEGNFATTAPPAGAIKVLYKTQGGVDNIRALTISNVDLDGNDISLSLDAVEIIKAFLGGDSEPLTREKLTIISRASHPRSGNISYYYLDISDRFLSTATSMSASKSSIINIQPYLSEPFYNNDYNALISNAEITRASTKRYDVDRVSGYVYPSNYNAIAGIGKLDFTDLKYDSEDGVRALEQTIAYSAPASNYNISGSVTSFSTTPDDQDTEVRISRNDITNAIGTVPATLIDDFPSHFFSNSNAFVVVESKLLIEIDSGSVFNSSGAKYQSAVLAQQTSSMAGNNSNGQHETTIYPFSVNIASGSMNGDIFIRLKQENKVLSNGSMYVSSYNPLNVNYTLKSFLFATPNTENNLPVSLYYDNQVPYAPFASIQDSNYTHTGHINARYNGTKTSELDFSGIGSAISAKTFQGASYLLETPSAYTDTTYNALICSQSLDERELEEFLFEGTSDLPLIGTSFLGTISSTNPLTAPNDTSIAITTFSGQYIAPGDVLTINRSSPAQTELVQVLAVTNTTSGKFPVITLHIQRRFDGASTSFSFIAGDQVLRTAGSRIFRAKGSRLIPIGRERVWIKDNKTIVKTNDRGFVIELSTTCTV